MNRNLTKDLPTGHAVTRVEIAYNQALAYVWGRQDGIGSIEPRDTILSEYFAEAFAKHVRNFILHKSFHQTNLQSAYQHWIKTGDIDV